MKSVTFQQDAYQDFCNWAAKNIKVFNKINELIKDIGRTPFKGKGKPEPMKHQYKGYWSRRITDEHRLVYKITENEIFIYSCKEHYGSL